MTADRKIAMELLKKVPEDKLGFVIQIMHGVNGLLDIGVDCLVESDNGQCEEVHIDTSEIEHLKKYRALDEHGKRMVNFSLQEEWERSIFVD